MSIGREKGKVGQGNAAKLDQPYLVSVGISVCFYSQTEHDLNRLNFISPLPNFLRQLQFPSIPHLRDRHVDG